MKLAEFVLYHLDEIIEEWEGFASTIPGTGSMDRAALEDHARLVLETIAREMGEEAEEGAEERDRASYRSPAKETGGSPGARHASERLSYGFTVHQIMAEFQALRLSVMRRWSDTVDVADKAMLEDLLLFNKGIDDAVMESVAAYTSELNTAREIFLGIVGHDLRSPLAVMSISASMIENDSETTVKQRRLAARIGQSGRRVEKLLSDLMDMTRTRLGGNMPLTRESVDLREVVEEVTEEFKAAHPNVILEDRFEGDLRGCWDSERLIQLLLNLLTNAVKYGVVDRPIKLRAVSVDDHVRVELHNEGPPIPERIKHSVFEPFVATQRQEKVSVGEAGIGLGLYICRIITEAHGGVIEVSSSKAEGTTFCVSLPREAPPERAEQQNTKT